jgi:hypothetical protein
MNTYQHSGAVSPVGLVAAMFAGLCTAIALGFVYAVFIVWVPFIYLCILGTLFFGFAMGAVVGWMARVGKIRNNLVVAILGLGTAIIGIYVEWGASPLAFAGWDEAGLSGFDPLVMFNFMAYLYEHGSWGLTNGAPMTGIPLAIIWVIEAGIIVCTSTMTAFAFTATLPFCERCYQWTRVEKAILVLSALTAKEETLARLRAGDLAALSDLPIATVKPTCYVQVDAACCPTCTESNFLTVNLVTRTVNGKGEEQLKTDALVTNLIVTPAQIAYARTAGIEAPLIAESPPIGPPPQQVTQPESFNFGQPTPPKLETRPEDLRFQ